MKVVKFEPIAVGKMVKCQDYSPIGMWGWLSFTPSGCCKKWKKCRNANDIYALTDVGIGGGYGCNGKFYDMEQFKDV